MTKQEKMHTVELTEQELARVLFVMGSVGAELYGKSIQTHAYEKLKVEYIKDSIGEVKFYAAVDRFYEKAKLPNCNINYYSIQKEWETFLGIGGKNKDILGKIANMERELAELKVML